MSNGNKLIVAALFTTLLCAAAMLGWQIADSYGWKCAIAFALVAVWVVSFMSLILSYALEARRHLLGHVNLRKRS